MAYCGLTVNLPTNSGNQSGVRLTLIDITYDYNAQMYNCKYKCKTFCIVWMNIAAKRALNRETRIFYYSAVLPLKPIVDSGINPRSI